MKSPAGLFITSLVALAYGIAAEYEGYGKRSQSLFFFIFLENSPPKFIPRSVINRFNIDAETTQKVLLIKFIHYY